MRPLRSSRRRIGQVLWRVLLSLAWGPMGGAPWEVHEARRCSSNSCLLLCFMMVDDKVGCSLKVVL